jgi:hypothetical protein
VSISRIRGDGFRPASGCFPHRLDHGQKLLAVHGLLGYLRRYDYLGVRVCGDLRIVSLHKTLPCVVLHHARFRVHEIVLPRRLRRILSCAAKPDFRLLPLLRILEWPGEVLFATASDFARRKFCWAASSCCFAGILLKHAYFQVLRFQADSAAS